MSFSPVAPIGGVAGWNFVKRTEPRQRAEFVKSPEISRLVDHFRSRIGSIKNAEDLVADRNLLKVTLGAFGLDEDLEKRFFIRKILTDGSKSPKALANRLADVRYRRMAAAFGFGDGGGAKTSQPGFADRIIEAYKIRQFEIEMGKSNNSMRLALNFRREITDLANRKVSDNTGWYTILGSPPLRKVVEQAFNLPIEFAGLPLNRQVETLKDKFTSLLGSRHFSNLSRPENLETVIRKFLVLDDIYGQSGAAASSPALSLLQDQASTTSLERTISESLIKSYTIT